MAHALAPLLIAVPVAVVIATMLGRALGVAHPDLGFAAAVNTDAEAFYLGETIYRDPADGYTGQLYTPLFPFLVSLLHRVDLWGGWPLLVNYAATLALVGLAAALAFDRAATGWDERWPGWGRSAWALFAWWLVSVLPLNLLFEGRSDHTAWALRAVRRWFCWRGARTAPRAALRSWWSCCSAAFWAKQTAIVASVAAVVWVFAPRRSGRRDRRRALAFCAALLVRQPRGARACSTCHGRLGVPASTSSWRRSTRSSPSSGRRPASSRATSAAARAPSRRCWLPRWRSGRGLGACRPARGAAARQAGRRAARLARRSPRGGGDPLRARGRPAAVYFRLKVGSEPNQYVGVLWGIGLLAALAWRRLARVPGTALVAAAP